MEMEQIQTIQGAQLLLRPPTWGTRQGLVLWSGLGQV